jgi:hypothetical protein
VILKKPVHSDGLFVSSSECLYGDHVGVGGAGPDLGPSRALRQNMPPHCPSPVIAHRSDPFAALHWALRQREFGGFGGRLATA